MLHRSSEARLSLKTSPGLGPGGLGSGHDPRYSVPRKLQNNERSKTNMHCEAMQSSSSGGRKGCDEGMQQKPTSCHVRSDTGPMLLLCRKSWPVLDAVASHSRCRFASGLRRELLYLLAALVTTGAKGGSCLASMSMSSLRRRIFIAIERRRLCFSRFAAVIAASSPGL